MPKLPVGDRLLVAGDAAAVFPGEWDQAGRGEPHYRLGSGGRRGRRG